MPEDTDWLSGCIPWSGKVESLPIGYQGPLEITAVKLIKSWKILDVESETGFATKKTAELQKGDVIIGATPNDNSIALILQNYGSDAFRFTDGSGNNINPKQWFDQYKTNPFVLKAINDKKRELLQGDSD